MEKLISVSKELNGSIRIKCEGSEEVIHPEEKCISAEALYRLLDYSSGDVYKVERIQDDDHDNAVFDFFAELIEEIAEKVSKIE